MKTRVPDCAPAVHAFHGPEAVQGHVLAHDVDRTRVKEVVERLKALRKRTTFGGLDWKMLRDDGRP